MPQYAATGHFRSWQASSMCTPNQITQWKTRLLDRAAQLFGAGTGQAEKPVDMKVLHAKIGELALENDFLEAALTKTGLLGARR